jgi:acyl-CoA synthetase (NDP forming)
MGFLTAWEGEELLRKHGLPVVESELVQSVQDALVAAHRIGFPVVLKYVSSDIIHKTEAGVLALDVRNESELEREFHRIVSNAKAYIRQDPQGDVLVQRKSTPGVELIVGVKRDPLFGHFLLLGLGGVFVEVLKDVSIRRMPVTRATGLDMMKELKGYPILNGARTGVPIHEGAVLDLVSRLNELIENYPEIEEMDLNPVLATDRETVICDVRINMGQAVQRPSPVRRSPDDLGHFISPKSIAIVGASNHVRKNGGRLFRYIVENGYPGKVYPIHPKDREIQGFKAYKTVLDIPGSVDLACIIVPAHDVLGVLESCAAKGIRAAIVYSSGFAEIGPDGKHLQDDMCAFAAENGIRLVGPNSLGVVSPPNQLYTAFGGVLESTAKRQGHIAMVSQSGAIGSALLSRAWDLGAGLSHWVSVGNEADTTVADFVHYFADDDFTRVITLFVESIKDFDGFQRATKRALDNQKPIVLFKTGRSAIGQRAVQSHTGSIAGDDKLYDEVFRDLGVIRVHDLQSMIDFARAFDIQPIPKGNRVGVVTASGGACSMIADLCDDYNLQLPRSRSLTEEVQQFIPPFGSAENPIDVTAEVISNPESFKQVLTAVVESEEIDSVIVMLTTNADPGASVIANGILDVFRTHNKPIVVGRLGADSIASNAMRIYEEAGFPVYPMPDQVVKVVDSLTKYHQSTTLFEQREGGEPCHVG